MRKSDDYNRQTDKSDQKNGFEGSESLCENETAREENIRERIERQTIKEMVIKREKQIILYLESHLKQIIK